MRFFGKWFWGTAALLLLSLAMPRMALAGVLDNIQSTYQGATASWMNGAMNAARDVFAAAAGLEFAWWAGSNLLKKSELNEILTGAMMKVVSLGFFFTFMTMAPQWIPTIIQSFTQIGQQVGGTGAVTPSSVVDLGVQDAAAMINALTGNAPGITSGFAALGKYMLSSIVIGISALLVAIGFAIAAFQLLLTIIESYIVIGGGMVMMGFLGSRWTLPFGEKYIGYAVSTGMKLMVIYLIIGLGSSVSQQMMGAFAQATQAGNFTVAPYFNVAIGALIYGALAFMVPQLAGSFMNGSPSMSMANVGTAGAAIAGGTIAAGAKGLSGVAGGVNATIGAAKGGADLGKAAYAGAGGMNGIAAAMHAGTGKGADLGVKMGGGAASPVSASVLGLGGAMAGGMVGGVAAGAKGGWAAAKQGAGALGGMAKDAVKGVGGRQSRNIAGQLGDKAVQGWGEGTGGGNFANRMRAGGGAGQGGVTSQAGAAGNSIGADAPGAGRPGGASVGAEAGGVQSRGGQDGIGGGQGGGAAGTGSRADPRDADHAGLTRKLDDMARQHKPRLPSDGHAGGISIRLRHHED